MTDLPLLGGPLSVEFLASGPASHFHLLRTTHGHGGAGASPPGEEAESHARLLSAAPVMLDLLAVLLLRWDDAAAADGVEAAAWLSAFAGEVREALQVIVGPRAPGTQTKWIAAIAASTIIILLSSSAYLWPPTRYAAPPPPAPAVGTSQH